MPVLAEGHSPSVTEQGLPTSVGMPDVAMEDKMETTPPPSPVDNLTMYSSSRDFYHSIETLGSLMNTLLEQVNVLSTCVREQEHLCLETLRRLERELAGMSLNLASLIYSASSNWVAQIGSLKPPSPNASRTGSTPGG
jgi:hypothetical protein